MSIEKLVLQNRSYRAFDERSPIPVQLMRDLVDLARKTASGMNKQPLRYRILSEKSDIQGQICLYIMPGADTDNLFKVSDLEIIGRVRPHIQLLHSEIY